MVYKTLKLVFQQFYNYIDSLSNKTVPPTINDHVDLRTILNIIQKVIPKYVSLPSDLTTNI